MASQKMSLKLLVDKSGQKVLFAEANKDFVDFLFHIFSLPLGTLIEFLGSKQMVGCLGKLKDSIQSLNETYIQPGIYKDDIFNPKTPYAGNRLLLSYDASSSDQPDASKTIYMCSRASQTCYQYECSVRTCRGYATLFAHAQCPGCNNPMSDEAKIVIPKKQGAVEPMSTISSITLINSFGVKDLGQLEEKVVSFGKDEALKLLKASLSTDNVLTTLFLHKNYA
ncbi:hypothetical protein Tco_1277541 [Tanacetum coccineum]